jgi:glycosyltransferase involved in cell wall biosynthesis
VRSIRISSLGRLSARDPASAAASPSDPRPAGPAGGLVWVREFARAHGRPLRVLHLGNVANNAYNNAKIQRQRGIEADVACWDYYHVMGSPEWEDADYEGDVGDPFFPDWRRVDLRGYRRPRWFAQGRLDSVQRYFAARRDGRRLAAAFLWRRLAFERWLLCRSTPTVRATARLARTAHRWRLRIANRARMAGAVAVAAGNGDLRGTGTRALALVRPAEQAPGARTVVRPGSAGLADRTLARYRELFPTGAPMTEEDLVEYLPGLPRWHDLMRRYDVVQAYSTDPIIPVLCGLDRYAAYEHGTLRATPFGDDWQARVCALGYREASVVFVTNSDVVPATRRLGLDPDRLVKLPHAVDSDRLLAFADAHAHLAPRSGAEVTFVAPSRQDWVDGDPSWTKGNDRALRAFALLRDRGFAFRVLLAEWGRDLGSTRVLIDELDLAEHVEWIPPLRKRALWEAYLRSHAVLDQFVLAAIGGVAFEAMALGRRVITALDLDAARAFFGEAPALLPASEPGEIADAMAAVIADPLDDAGLGRRARDWFASFHSADRIVDLQAAAYARIVAAS